MNKLNIDFEGLVNKEKRFCIQKLRNFLDTKQEYEGQIAVLYGLRRTGKTTIMQQIIKEYKDKPKYKNKWAFYEVDSSDTMTQIYKTLEEEYAKKTKLVCIDELTYAQDFITESKILANVFAKLYGMQIIVAGTDSLIFNFAENRALFDRIIRIKTTHIPYAEHSQVLKTTNIDDYIEHGGLMRKGLSDNEITNNDTARKYLDSAVADNIAYSINKSDEDSPLKIFSLKDLRTIVEKIVELYNGKFNKEKMQNELQTVGIIGVLHLLDKYKYKSYIDLIDVNRTNIVQTFSEIIKADTKIKTKITDEMVEELEYCLINMDLLSAIKKRRFFYTKEIGWKEKKITKEFYIIQPAIKYSHLQKGLNFITENEDYFSDISDDLRKDMLKKLDEQTKGYMLEQIVTFDVSKDLIGQNYDVFKPSFIIDSKDMGEYDLLIRDMDKNNYYAFEIKHSNQVNENQYKTLSNNLITEFMSWKFGNDIMYAVLYQGESFFEENGVVYFNVSDFLIAVNKYKNIELAIDNLMQNCNNSKLKKFNLEETTLNEEKYQFYFAACKEAIKGNPFEFFCIKPSFLSPTTKDKNYIELCEIAINKQPILLKKIELDKFIEKEKISNFFVNYMNLCEIAVNKNPFTIKYIKTKYFPNNEKYIELWKIAIEKEPELIEFLTYNKNLSNILELFQNQAINLKCQSIHP